MGSSPELDASYVDHVARLEQRLDTDTALRRAVGGEFVAIGKLEYHLLRSRGLRDDHLVVDVGCGSGRLACQLAPYPGIRCIGTDVVPRLLEYARDLCGRPDWSFVPASGTTIPCGDAQADFVCFFSVFTHLHQEEIYRYLREAARVLKPGGVLLFSFLEFRVPSHWAAFIASVDHAREDQHLNQFIERDAIRAWAAPAGFDVRSLHGGDTEYIPLPEEVRYESGVVARGAGSLGQSVAVLQKRDPAARAPASAAPPAPPPEAAARLARLINTSARTHIAAGGSATLGFMIDAAAPQRVLVRAVGPGLRVFGVAHPIEQPALAIHSADTIVARSGEDTASPGELAEAARRVGAFPLPPDGTDAAVLVTLPAGSHTAVATSARGGENGEVLLEAYLV